MTPQIKSLREITTQALDLLTESLGPVDTLRFLSQFTTGHGDYTEDRKALFDSLTLEQIVTDIKQRREKS